MVAWFKYSYLEQTDLFRLSGKVMVWGCSGVQSVNVFKNSLIMDLKITFKVKMALQIYNL